MYCVPPVMRCTSCTAHTMVLRGFGTAGTSTGKRDRLLCTICRAVARYPFAWPSFRDFSTAVADALQALDVDLIHTVDADAYGAVAALRRAAGLGFAHTQILTTMHGCISWHRRGNGLPRTWDEGENMEGLAHLLRHSDVVCYPSNYMRLWVDQNLPSVSGSEVVVPNCLPHVIRSAGITSASRRDVNEIVFFGRLERRKGLGLFATTVRNLVANLAPDSR